VRPSLEKNPSQKSAGEAAQDVSPVLEKEKRITGEYQICENEERIDFLNLIINEK
jgi:hypothetical protein